MSLLAAVASACVALANARGWVALLVQPPFLPRNPLPAWLLAVLAGAHVALALAAWLVWRQPMAASRQVLAMNHWGWLLALGALWPAAFFGLHQLAPALAVAAGLVACGALTLRRFAELDSAAAVLLIPYCGYTAAALYVSVGFWWLNH